jgi:putative ABC transport system permease protein
MAIWRNLALNLSGAASRSASRAARSATRSSRSSACSPSSGDARAEDDRAGAPAAIVLGYRLWQDRFGGDASVLGRRLTLDGESFEVVGVMPRDFRFPTREDRVLDGHAFPRACYEDRGNTYLYGDRAPRPA